MESNWIKHDFYIVSEICGMIQMDKIRGYTDNVFNYCRLDGEWNAVDPLTGLSVVTGETKKEILEYAKDAIKDLEKYRTKKVYAKKVKQFNTLVNKTIMKNPKVYN